MATDERVRIVVEANDRATPVLRGITDSAARFGSLLNTALTLGGITTALAGVGAAINKALDFGAAGASLINLERSFERFAEATGQSADQVIADMQRMSNGMLSEAEAMQQFNRTFLLSGAEMAQEMPRIIQLATAATTAGMGDFQYLLNSLTIGIGRLSPLFLDNLGLSIKLSDAYDAYAATVGKSASELTKTEQQTAVLNEVMRIAAERFGDLDSAGNQMAGGSIPRLRAQWAGLADDLKKSTVPAVESLAQALIDVTNATLSSVPGTAQYLDRMLTLTEALAASGNLSQFQMVGLDQGALEELARRQAELDTDQRRRVLELTRAYEAMFPNEAAALANRLQQEWVSNQQRALDLAERTAQAQQTVESGAAGLLLKDLQEQAGWFPIYAEMYGDPSMQMLMNRQAYQAQVEAVRGLTVSEEQYQAIAAATVAVLGEEAAALTMAAFASNNFVMGQTESAEVAATVTAEFNRQRIAQLDLISTTIAMEQDFEKAASSVGSLGAGARIATGDLSGLNAAISSAISLASNLAGAAEGAAGALQGMATDVRVSMMKARDYARGIEKPQMDWFTTGKKAWEMPEAVAEYGRAMGTWIENQGRQVWRDHEESISSAGAAYGGLTDSMESYYDAWKSKADGIASSILSPTQDVNLAAMEEKLYGRQDTFDENARRAMDVFEKGTESPWAAQLGLGSKEDAFQYIKDFYAGKLPEDQYNWDAAIGQYQDQMEQTIGADSLQKMFEEKLIGAGWGPEGAQLTDALQAPMGDGGTAAAETFAGTFTAYSWVTPGTTAGEMILTGLRQRLEKGDSRLNSGIEALVIKTVRNFIGAGGELP